LRFGATDYREAAIERLSESQTLLRTQHHAGSVYLAGRGVESMLRALVWKGDADIRLGKKSLETNHDLKKLLAMVANLGLLIAGQRDESFKDRINRVGLTWHNNLRFASEEYLASWWKKIGRITKQRSLKFVAERYFQDCSAIIARGQELCQS
jgi:hypothetical protein